MTDKEIMDIYTGLVPFLAEASGPSCEIVIHDITNPDHSLVAIGNNVSGRDIGNPMTDFARHMLTMDNIDETEYLANYKGQTKNGEFISSTYFIRNEGRIIGMLCLNKELGPAQEFTNALTTLLNRYNLSLPSESKTSENLDSPVQNIVQSRITDIISRSGLNPKRMSMTEKIRIVHTLNEEGVLIMKGAVGEIASHLSVSIPTVYRYLNKYSADGASIKD